MQNRIIFITGRKGSGKTAFATSLVNRQYLSGRRVFAINPTNSMFEAPPSGTPVLPGSPTITTTAELLDPAFDTRSLVIIPGVDPSVAESCFQYVFACGNMVLLVDEVDLWLSHTRPSETLLSIIRYGRHRQIDLCAISQRPANVVRDLTAQADFIVMFQSTENRDVEYLAARIGRDSAEMVRNLPQFKPLIYSAYTGGVVKGGTL